MITKIYIQNFKSIRKVDLELRSINVLVGPNGAGKSNFVSFFNLILNLHDKRLKVYVLEKGGANRLLYLGSKVSKYLGGDIIFGDNYHYGISLNANSQDNLSLVAERYGIIPYSSIDSIVYYRYEHNDALAPTEANLAEDSSALAGRIKESISSFRIYHFHDTSSNAPLKQTARVPDDRYLRPDGSNLAAFLYNLQQNYPKSFNQIEATIRLIAPFFDRFDLQPTGNGEYIRLNWQQKGTDMYLDTSDFSDGTLRFIALATLLLQPNPPATILIDEPELGLHPYAITILAGLIQSVSESAQVIVSTQSVGLVNEFNPADIIVVENQKNESTFRRLDEVELKGWLQEYTLGELWNKNVFGGNP